MIDRNAILALADAAAETNKPLRDLLLTVAGMIDPDGTVNPPDGREKWSVIASEAGAFGKGLALAQRRGRASVKPLRQFKVGA